MKYIKIFENFNIQEMDDDIREILIDIMDDNISFSENNI